MGEEVGRVSPDQLDRGISEAWERDPGSEMYLRYVSVCTGEQFRDEPLDWLVGIRAREYFRDDPLGRELQQRLERAMLAVPGVTSAENASWETWYVTGTVSGEALCRACAEVIDDMTDRLRAGYSELFHLTGDEADDDDAEPDS